MNIASLTRAAAVMLVAAGPTSFAQTLPPGTPPVEQMAVYNGADRHEKLLAAARTEGSELSVYHVYTALSRVMAEFSKKYGIKVSAWRSGSETVVQRLVNEARGNRFEADIMQNNAPEAEFACREKLLLEVRSPQQAKLMPEAVPAHHCWVGFAVDVFIVAYNTTKVSKQELPKTYQELLDPKWKGRLGIEADDHGWFGTLSAMLGEQQTHGLFRKIVATNGLSLRRGHSLLANLIASGEIPLGIAAYSWTPEQLKQKGAPIEVHLMDPMIAQFSSIGVARKAKNPYTALLFYDWLLDEGQKVLHDLKFVPTSRADQPSVLKREIRYIDPGQALQNRDKWLKDYERIVVKPRAAS